ncbi:hypothetical protein [Sphingomonas solaris]|uniref:Uncharacterized protein n=1 Tax=Alterirhizorhabdus solaris TaxID=2529389 RepID=A0A558R5G6_9SPHN|nr:hypothetical protein [Sphingomonas solaris]TVV74624.1 hypothetical protein FOY91_09210 [Sphingomonas solaris]
MHKIREPMRIRFTRVRRLAADGCHLVLSATLWISGILLAALGAMLAFMILMADGRPSRFFAQLQNLSTHYLSADPAARASFHGQLLAVFLGIVGLLVIARLPSFALRLRRELRRGGDRG